VKDEEKGFNIHSTVIESRSLVDNNPDILDAIVEDIRYSVVVS
jgi:hypothetical protein